MLDPVETRPITAEDVLRRNSPWRECELWDGLPLVREPAGGQAEAVAARIVAPLGLHVRERALGWTFMSSQGFLLARDPDRMLASDGAYVSKERLPRVPEQDFVPLAPDFLIEVRSPDVTWEQTVMRCGLWITHGAGIAWAVEPLARKVAVFRADGTSEVLEGEGKASAAPVLPDFQVDLADLFEGL